MCESKQFPRSIFKCSRFHSRRWKQSKAIITFCNAIKLNYSSTPTVLGKFTPKKPEIGAIEVQRCFVGCSGLTTLWCNRIVCSEFIVPQHCTVVDLVAKNFFLCENSATIASWQWKKVLRSKFFWLIFAYMNGNCKSLLLCHNLVLK